MTAVPTLAELRAALIRAETEYECARYIENTDRMHRERLWWNFEIGRLREEIARREPWSGLREKRA
jgi:hypothetical protein